MSDERNGIWVRSLRDGRDMFITAEQLADIEALARGEDPGQLTLTHRQGNDSHEPTPSGRSFEDLL